MVRQTTRIWTLIALVAGLVLFAACGGGGAAEPKTEPAPADTVAAPTEVAAAPTNTPEPAPTQAFEPAETPPPEAVPAGEETPAEPSIMDIDINRAPGHSIGFQNHLEPAEVHFYLFLASPGDTIGAGVVSDADLMIGIQNATTGDILASTPAKDNFLFLTIEENALYNIIIENSGDVSGDYQAAFEASPKVSFALDPIFTIIGRLPEGGLLYYTFTALGGVTLKGNAIPHPDTPVNLRVQVRDLETQALLYEADDSGAGENEQFSFTIPDDGSGQPLTYIVSVDDVDGNKGAYLLSVASDAASMPASTPESVVQAVIDAAVTGDFSALGALCDPLGENDGDTQRICELAANEADREDFIQNFEKAQIMGAAVVSPQGDRAQVSILFGAGGDLEGTFELVNRDGQWYLVDF